MRGVVFYYTATMTLPPDRSDISTEQIHSETQMLDLLSTEECVNLLAVDHNSAISAVQSASSEIAQFIDALHGQIESGGRLVYIGCGTSGRLGVLDAAECPPTFQSSPELIIGIIAGGDRALRISSEAKEDDRNGLVEEFNRLHIGPNDTVLGIAAGGTTPWVVGGIELAKEHGAMTGFLTCSDVPVCADYQIYLNTGPEPLTGSTRLKAGTATKLALNIITTTLFTKLGKVYGNLMVDLKASNQKLQDRAIRIVSTICELNRDESASLLEQSQWDVKRAIVMHSCSLSNESAKLKLEEAGGNLRSAL